MTNSPTASHQQSDVFSALCLQLTTGSEKLQQQAILQLANFGNDGEQVLIDFLQQRQTNFPTWIDGKVCQVLYQSESLLAKNFLQAGWDSKEEIALTPRSWLDKGKWPLGALSSQVNSLG